MACLRHFANVPREAFCTTGAPKYGGHLTRCVATLKPVSGEPEHKKCTCYAL